MPKRRWEQHRRKPAALLCCATAAAFVATSLLPSGLHFAQVTAARFWLSPSKLDGLIPESFDLSAVQRKFVRLKLETFLDEPDEVGDERELLRNRFSEMEDLENLFEANDDEYQASAQTPEDLAHWAMHEQALIEAMEDASIFGLPRLQERPTWLRLGGISDERQSKLENQRRKPQRRKGKRNKGLSKRH